MAPLCGAILLATRCADLLPAFAPRACSGRARRWHSLAAAWEQARVARFVFRRSATVTPIGTIGFPQGRLARRTRRSLAGLRSSANGWPTERWSPAGRDAVIERKETARAARGPGSRFQPASWRICSCRPDAGAGRHCARLSPMIFIDDIAAWLRLA